jgi:hypothetical protein
MDHKLDNIKKALTPDAPLHTDKDELWNAIELEMDKDKKRKRPIILYIFLFGFGLTFLGIALAPKHKQMNQKNNMIVINHQNEHPKSEYKEPSAPNDSPSTVEKITLKTPSTISSKNKTVGSTETQNNKSLAFIRKSEKNAAINLNQTTLPKVPFETENIFLTPDQNLKQPDTKDNGIHLQKYPTGDLALLSDGNSLSSEATDLATIGVRHSNNISLIPSLEYNVIASDMFAKNTLTKNPQISKVNHVESSKRWELLLSSGIHTWNKFDQTFTPELQIISLQRKAITTPKESFNTTFMVKKEVLRNWYLGIGLQYNHLTEVIQAEDISVTTREIKSDSAFFYEGVSGVDYFSGNIKETRRQGFLIYSPNYIRRWNIPLELSYKYRLGRLQFVPSIAILYNISQRYEGITMGMDGTFIYKNKEGLSNIYKSSGIVSWSFALDAEWFISNNTAIKLGVSSQNDLSSALLNETFLRERYRQLGIRIGLVRTFLMAN